MPSARTEGGAELRWFIKQFGKFPKDVRQDLRPKLRAIGTAALAGVRAHAAWSTRIPSATRLQIGLSKRNPGLAIVVNKNRAPHGRPYENNDRDGAFRAPFFGDRSRWYAHPARPFLVRGARPHFEKVDADIKDVVDEAARKAGFR
ncbi:HK97 gp10 family phage protein [Nonomuraea sp. NPDC002799]